LERVRRRPLGGTCEVDAHLARTRGGRHEEERRAQRGVEARAHIPPALLAGRIDVGLRDPARRRR